MNRPVWTPPLAMAERFAARIALRRRSSSASASAFAGRLGSIAAFHSASSARRLPTPAMTDWSMIRDLIAMRLRETRARKSARETSAASGPRRSMTGSSRTRPSRRLSRNASRPPSAKRSSKRSQILRSRLGTRSPASSSSTTIRPAIPRCRPSVGPSPEVSHHIDLPRRSAVRSSRPTSASAISPGACGRQTWVSLSSTATIVRCRARSAISARARSTSGSSGMTVQRTRTLARAATAGLRSHPPRAGHGSATDGRGPRTTELFFGAGMPGLAPPAGPPLHPAPPAPDRPRPAPARSGPPLGDLADVPAGVYAIGEPGEEHELALDAFRIGRFPVTNAHVRAFVDATAHPTSDRLAARLADAQLDDHPATEVPFADALAFCAWANARLPTGEEWEAAARGPEARPWPWGPTFDEARCACVEAGAGWTAPVRAHPDGAAWCGAEQLAGNVWEWVSDPRDDDGWRTVRGGSYLDLAWGVRASRALPADPARATPTTGFRIAKDA